MQELTSMATTPMKSKQRPSHRITSSRFSLHKRPDSSRTLTTNSPSDDSDNDDIGAVSKTTLSRRTHQRSYVPKSSGRKQQDIGPLDYSHRSEGYHRKSNKTPLEDLSTRSERISSSRSRSSTPNTDSDVEHIIGTFSVPTFKEEELSTTTSHDASRSTSKRRGSTHSNGRGVDPPEERELVNNNNNGAAGTVVDRIPTRRKSSNSAIVFMESERALSDDDWMEDALLDGLSGVKDDDDDGSASQIFSVPLGQPLNGCMEDDNEKIDSSSHSDEVLPSVKASRRRSSRVYVLDSSSHAEDVASLGQQTKSHRSSQSNSDSRASSRSSRRRSSKSSAAASKELGNDFFLSRMESTLGEKHLNVNDGIGGATF